MDFSADREKLAREAMGVGKVSEISPKSYYRKCSDCIVTYGLDIYQVIFHVFFQSIYDLLSDFQFQTYFSYFQKIIANSNSHNVKKQVEQIVPSP